MSASFQKGQNVVRHILKRGKLDGTVAQADNARCPLVFYYIVVLVKFSRYVGIFGIV